MLEAVGCSVTIMAAAKSFFPEDHPQFTGIYWGEISAPGAREIVDWSDAVVCVGTIFNDYSTVGWTSIPSGAGVRLAFTSLSRLWAVQIIAHSPLTWSRRRTRNFRKPRARLI